MSKSKPVRIALWAWAISAMLVACAWGSEVVVREESLWLYTADGVRLQARLAQPSAVQCCGIAVLCHPHPLYGGTMNNQVVMAVAQRLLSAGLAVLRFNFRGVGKSGGQYGGGEKECEDVLAAVKYARNRGFAVNKIILIGYSFGAAVAARALKNLPEEIAYVGIALPIEEAASEAWTGLLAERRRICLIVAGRDEIVSVDNIWAVAKQRRGVTKIVVVGGASHFFDTEEHLSAAAEAVVEFVQRICGSVHRSNE